MASKVKYANHTPPKRQVRRNVQTKKKEEEEKNLGAGGGGGVKHPTLPGSATGIRTGLARVHTPPRLQHPLKLDHVRFVHLAVDEDAEGQVIVKGDPSVRGHFDSQRLQ